MKKWNFITRIFRPKMIDSNTQALVDRAKLWMYDNVADSSQVKYLHNINIGSKGDRNYHFFHILGLGNDESKLEVFAIVISGTITQKVLISIITDTMLYEDAYRYFLFCDDDETSTLAKKILTSLKIPILVINLIESQGTEK